MTYSNALQLNTPGFGWEYYLANDDDNGILGYSFYSSTFGIPSYYYIGGNPANGFTTEYQAAANTGNEAYMIAQQQATIRYLLSDTWYESSRLVFRCC